MPTSAVLSAPTSLPPSPHMSVCMPRSRHCRTTASLPSGDMRAKTVTCSAMPHASGWACTSASKTFPVTTRSWPAARSCSTPPTEKPTGEKPSPPPELSAAAHSKPPAAASDPSTSRSSSGGLAARGPPSAVWASPVMPTSVATCRAVSAPSPVSMIVRWFDCRSEPMTLAESARTGQPKARKPAKRRPDSTHSRGRLAYSCTSWCGLSPPHCL
eukprot:5413184-Prymnesium_polylepis.1